MSYRRFESLMISATDEPEDMVAKQQVNELEKDMKEYPAVKAEIDKAFLTIKDRENLNAAISAISKKHAGNPLIDEYVRVASLLDKAKKAQEDMAEYGDDEFAAKEEMKDLASSGSDPSTIQAKQKTVQDIAKKKEDKKKEIDDLKRQALNAEKQMKEQLDKLKKDSARNIANL